MNKKTFFIAEIGINHNGSIENAFKLIDIAVNCGFDAVKFQKRDINTVYTKEQLDSPRTSPWGTTTREQKLGLEFGKKEYDQIDDYCKKKKIAWFASAWDELSLKFLDNYNCFYNKIASAMITNLNFLNAVAKQGKYTFISTGMSSTKNIDDAVDIFRKNKCDFELMHCVSTYPMSIKDANLRTINALSKKYDCKVGWSGHENGIAVSVCAAVLGATSIERHITLDRTMYGSDQAASIEEKGLKEMMSQIKVMQFAIGEEKIGHILDEEYQIAKKLRYWD